MKEHWIFISAHDPRNTAFARWAEICVAFEWMLILANAAATPTDYVAPFHSRIVIMAVSLLLLLMGFRGLLARHVHRFGSIALFGTNLLIFLASTFSIVSDYVAFHYG